MESNVNYTLAGLFVIVLGAATVAVVAWLSAATDQRIYDYYRVYSIESVAGLNVNAAVRYKGVDVGQVTSVGLDKEFPDWVELILRIERGTPIRAETTAKLVVQGITGLVYVELSGGTDSPPLRPTAEQPMPVLKSSPSLVAQVTSAFQDLTVKVDRLLSDDNLTAFRQTLANLAILSSTLAGRAQSLDQAAVNLENFTGTLVVSADKLNRAVDDAAGALANTAQASVELKPLLRQVNTTFVDASTMVDSVTQTSEALRLAFVSSLQDFQKLTRSASPELSVLLYDLDRLATALERFVQALERNPRMLLFGKPTNAPGPGESNR
ncbi:MAG: MCE family protein [Candidatus Competibacteraceae bacterium]|nr:MCE family protein [Candidatus Competibacteraceae bacterium]